MIEGQGNWSFDSKLSVITNNAGRTLYNIEDAWQVIKDFAIAERVAQARQEGILEALGYWGEVFNDEESLKAHEEIIKVITTLTERAAQMADLLKDARDDWAFAIAGGDPIYATSANQRDAQAWNARYDALAATSPAVEKAT